MSLSCLLFYYFTFIFFIFTTYILQFQFQFSQFLCLLHMLKLYTPYISCHSTVLFFFMIFMITLCFGFLGTLYIPDLQCPYFLSEQFSNPNVTSSSQLVACCTELYMRCVCVYVTSWCFTSVIIYTFFLCLAIQLMDKRDTVPFTVWVCVCFLCSVTVNEPWNMTIGEGFSQSSLQRCCTLTPPTQFNCSQFFEALWRKTFF